MYFQSAAHTRRFYIYIYIYKERKKTQIQVSESCSLFMCNYQCISTGCAIIFIVTFIHVMPLLIWFRYELLTVTVPVVKGEGGERSQVLLSVLKTRQLDRHGKAHGSPLDGSESQQQR